MQAKFPTGKDCLGFLQVSDKIHRHPRVVYVKPFVRVMVGFLEPRGVFLSSTKQFDQSNHLLPLKFEVNGKPYKNDSVPKKMKCSFLVVQFVIPKNTAC